MGDTRNRSIFRFRGVIAGGIIAVFIVCILIASRGRRLDLGKDQRVPSLFEGSDKAAIRSKDNTRGDVHASLSEMLPVAPKQGDTPQRKLSKAEREELQRLTDRVRHSFEDGERKRKKEILNVDRGGFGLVMLAIRAPSKEELSQMAFEATAALSSIPKDAPISTAAYSQISALFTDFADYPEEVKFVGLNIKSDPKDKTPWWGGRMHFSWNTLHLARKPERL